MKYFILFLLAMVIGIPFSSFGEDRNPPFSPGERLMFELKWGVIPAGEATLEVLPIETLNGSPVFHFVLTASSNAFVDAFYKIRDRIDAYTDLGITHSVLYKKKQLEGKTHRDIVVSFDWGKKEALYTNYGSPKPPVALLPGAFDPLAVFYYTRTLDFKENSLFERPVSDGRKTVMAQARVIKREIIEVGGKATDVFLIEPELKDIGGVFQKSRNAKIQLWMTADERRMLVRLKSKVIVGSFVGELVRSEPSFSFADGKPQ